MLADSSVISEGAGRVMDCNLKMQSIESNSLFACFGCRWGGAQQAYMPRVVANTIFPWRSTARRGGLGKSAAVTQLWLLSEGFASCSLICFVSLQG